MEPSNKTIVAGEMAVCRIEEEEPWDGREMACVSGGRLLSLTF